jgi:hypothetical protein
MTTYTIQYQVYLAAPSALDVGVQVSRVWSNGYQQSNKRVNLFFAAHRERKRV